MSEETKRTLTAIIIVVWYLLITGVAVQVFWNFFAKTSNLFVSAIMASLVFIVVRLVELAVEHL